MKKTLTFIVLALCMLSAFSQSTEEKELVAEARLLYNSERASWHGTDIFLERFPEKKGDIGGYFSYSEGNKHTCLFYDKDADPNVLGAMVFDDSFVVEAADVNSASRKLTAHEKEIYSIRKKALEEVVKDTLFKWYEEVNPNFIPLVTKNSKKVYILSGPKKNGVIVFGNDYLIEFDKKNNIKSKKALHKNIMLIPYGNDKEDRAMSGMHSHAESTGELITATDICTLMLYCPYTGWENHIVISGKKVSIWSCEKNELTVMTREAWEKISEEGKEKNKK